MQQITRKAIEIVMKNIDKRSQIKLEKMKLRTEIDGMLVLVMTRAEFSLYLLIIPTSVTFNGLILGIVIQS